MWFEDNCQSTEELSQTFRSLIRMALHLIQPTKNGRTMHNLQKAAQGPEGRKPQIEIHRQVVSDAIGDRANQEKGDIGRGRHLSYRGTFHINRNGSTGFSERQFLARSPHHVVYSYNGSLRPCDPRITGSHACTFE